MGDRAAIGVLLRHRAPSWRAVALWLALVLAAGLLHACGRVDAATSTASAAIAPMSTATATAITVATTASAGNNGRVTATGTATVRVTAALTASTRAQPTATTVRTARRGPAGMPAVPVAQLPPEAQETIRRVDRGGPFPYAQDGVTFGNRERLLPSQPEGYYREYTVITPGSPDRGARRIIGGRGGELYYTEDHYESFVWVVR